MLWIYIEIKDRIFQLQSWKRLQSLEKKYITSGINKFILVLQKGVYLYEYVNDWKNISETLLAKTEKISTNLNIESITVKNCKWTCKKCLERT